MSKVFRCVLLQLPLDDRFPRHPDRLAVLQSGFVAPRGHASDRGIVQTLRTARTFHFEATGRAVRLDEEGHCRGALLRQADRDIRIVFRLGAGMRRADRCRRGDGRRRGRRWRLCLHGRDGCRGRRFGRDIDFGRRNEGRRRLGEIWRRRRRRFLFFGRLDDFCLEFFRKFLDETRCESDDKSPDQTDMQDADADQNRRAPRGIWRFSRDMSSKVVSWLFHGSSVAYTKLIPAQWHRDWRIWAEYASPSRHRFSSGAFFLKPNVITVLREGLVFRNGKRNFVMIRVNRDRRI